MPPFGRGWSSPLSCFLIDRNSATHVAERHLTNKNRDDLSVIWSVREHHPAYASASVSGWQMSEMRRSRTAP
jgi:hypothetical protein